MCTYTCEGVPGHSYSSNIKLLRNETSCQLTVQRDRRLEKEYFCTIEIYPEVNNGESCLLLSRTIQVLPKTGSLPKSIFIGVLCATAAIGVCIVLSVAIIVVQAIYTKRKNRNRQQQNGEGIHYIYMYYIQYLHLGQRFCA